MNFSLFSACPSSKNYPSARCASAADVCRDIDVFIIKAVSFDHITELFLLIEILVYSV
jgi:hypothetical protein